MRGILIFRSTYRVKKIECIYSWILGVQCEGDILNTSNITFVKHKLAKPKIAKHT